MPQAARIGIPKSDPRGMDLAGAEQGWTELDWAGAEQG